MDCGRIVAGWQLGIVDGRQGEYRAELQLKAVAPAVPAAEIANR